MRIEEIKSSASFSKYESSLGSPTFPPLFTLSMDLTVTDPSAYFGEEQEINRGCDAHSNDRIYILMVAHELPNL